MTVLANKKIISVCFGVSHLEHHWVLVYDLWPFRALHVPGPLNNWCVCIILPWELGHTPCRPGFTRTLVLILLTETIQPSEEHKHCPLSSISLGWFIFEHPSFYFIYSRERNMRYVRYKKYPRCTITFLNVVGVLALHVSILKVPSQ